MTDTDKQLIMVALGAAFLYIIWQKLSGAAKAAGQAIGAAGTAVYNAAGTLTSPISDVLAWWWMLDDPPGVGQVLGNIVLPNGSVVPLASVRLKVDANHAVYANVNNAVYQLQPSDANGNWPGILVVGA